MSDWEDKAKNFVKKMFGDTNEKRVKALQPYVNQANSFADAMGKLSDDELKGKTAEFKQRIDNALKDVPEVKLIADDAGTAIIFNQIRDFGRIGYEFTEFLFIPGLVYKKFFLR
mgnify:CR=1 FL=1